jgi:tetratricopeptide (TPR) repeat protein
LGQYQQAIAFHQQYLEIARDIGDRRGEANSLFNTALALKKLDNLSEAKSCFEAASAIFGELGLQNDIDDCEKEIQELEQASD